MLRTVTPVLTLEQALSMCRELGAALATQGLLSDDVLALEDPPDSVRAMRALEEATASELIARGEDPGVPLAPYVCAHCGDRRRWDSDPCDCEETKTWARPGLTDADRSGGNPEMPYG